MGGTGQNPNSGPLSLKRLTAAFAQMLGDRPGQADVPRTEPLHDPCEISPRSIVEATLFVGAEGDRSHTAEDLAALMRDVAPDEVRQAVEDLNRQYEHDDAPYRIVGGAGGYRMRLREEMARVRDKFFGRVKESRLSPRALEVLSVIAYRQPTTAHEIDQLRGVGSAALLAQLVRRGLIRRERHEGASREARYRTTERFLHLFRLENLSQLPRAAELDD